MEDCPEDTSVIFRFLVGGIALSLGMTMTCDEMLVYGRHGGRNRVLEVVVGKRVLVTRN